MTAAVAVVTAAVALLVEPALSAIAILGTLVLGAVLSTSIRLAHRMGDQFSESAARGPRSGPLRSSCRDGNGP